MGFLAGYGLMGTVIAVLCGVILLFIVFFKLWKEFIKVLVLLGPPALYNFIMGVRDVLTSGTWKALASAFWPPAAYWDKTLASNFWMGVSGLILWWIFAFGVAGWMANDWLGRVFPKVKISKSLKVFAAIPLTVPIMLILGGGLPNASNILPSLVAGMFVAFLRAHYMVWTIFWSLVVLGALIALVSGVFGGQTVYVKKEGSQAAGQGGQSRAEEHARTIRTLPKLPKSRWKTLESAASGYWRQKRQYPNAKLLVRDLGVSSVVAGQDTATITTDRGKGEVVHTKSGNFLVYL